MICTLNDMCINLILLFSAPPKFVETPINHYFKSEVITIGNVNDPICPLCFNCTVKGIPKPVVTWKYQTASMSDFMPVVTNQSNVSSSYFVQDNGQVNINSTISTSNNALFVLM